MISFHKVKDAALTDVVFRHVRKRHHFFRLSQVKLQHIWVPYCMFWNNGQFLSAAPLISLAPYGRQQVKRSAQRLCRSFPGTHSLCYLAQSLGWENALCFIKAINYEAPGGTMLASHPVICMQNSQRQVPAGTIQVLARMVPAKAVNWLQLAFKCCFYPYRHLAVAVANVTPIIFRARQPHLPTCCTVLTASHQHQVSLLHGSLKLHQLLSQQRSFNQTSVV